MCKTLLTIVVVAVVAMAGAARAAPSIAPAVPAVNLDEALNMTTCPIVVKINHNENRVPRYVKELTCATSVPRTWCEERGMQHYECCGASLQRARHRRHAAVRHAMRCEEVRDTVMVYYKDTNERVLEPFSVGCVCTVRSIGRATSE